MVKLRYGLFVIFALASLALTAFGQDVVIDWGTTPKKLVSFPTEVSKPISARVIVNNVNDVLYSYTVDITQTARINNDVGQLPIFPTEVALARTTNCAESIKNVNIQADAVTKAIRDMLTAPGGSDATKFTSISLKDTIATWNGKVTPAFITLNGLVTQLNAATDCNEKDKVDKAKALASIEALSGILDKIRKKINSDHQFIQVVTLFPENDYTVTVVERYTPVDEAGKPKLDEKGQPQAVPTEEGTKEFPFKPVSYILTLSGGILLSSIEQRSYLSRKDPISGNNVLAVDGTGFARPIGVALLNYQIPGARWYKNTMGLNLSSGVVVDLGTTKSDVSRLGWFGGVSLDFYHRLFITPGFHFGEFADFPVGLTRGSTIPANFGELNPVKRYTGHFAIAITYRATSLIKAPATDKTKK